MCLGTYTHEQGALSNDYGTVQEVYWKFAQWGRMRVSCRYFRTFVRW